MPEAAFTVAILAGGHSRRMGTDKALLPLDGVPLIERVLAATRPLDAPHLLITANPALDYLGLSRHCDLLPHQGPLGGLYTALTVAQTPAVLLLACDLPFITPQFLHLLAANLHSHQAVVPTDVNGPHPLCALYARSCGPLAERALQAGRLRLRAFVDALDVRYLQAAQWQHLDPHHRLLANLNTPEEFHFYNADPTTAPKSLPPL